MSLSPRPMGPHFIRALKLERNLPVGILGNSSKFVPLQAMAGDLCFSLTTKGGRNKPPVLSSPSVVI